MTAFAIRSELPLVDVRVAIGTLGAHICEHQADMALRARYALVQTHQGIAGFVVVKFEDFTQRLPRSGGVAVFAGQLQVAMGAVTTRRSLPRSYRQGRHEYNWYAHNPAQLHAHWTPWKFV